jgi:L,D-peptidoglycan transpeptidase YkuD (ErfK/YbiS/YcfS/YnhG family)
MIANSNAERTSLAKVRAISGASPRGALSIFNRRLVCALGRSGRRALKREGDGATPVGLWRVREAFYRPDRQQRPLTSLPLRAIRRGWGWCDAPNDRNYNRLVRLPYPASTELLWRDDGLYDLIIVLGYNDLPRRRCAGSAIFVHVASPGYAPTEGCITLSVNDIRWFLEKSCSNTAVRVMP